ncbi:hypothetical protein EC991_009222 [Linnemannia zychae]|nr:hypothetical protein EC991_009222 [Linnemannia zychae]
MTIPIDSKLRLVIDETQILSDKNLRYELKIIYWGAGLSMRTLHWAQSSGDGSRSTARIPFHTSSFQDGQVLTRNKRLSIAFEEQLAGRFRPIEGILENGKWETSIERTESVITPWKNRQHRENLCGELNR